MRIMNCPHCGNSGFRISRLRVADLPRFFLLQVPARCQLCRQRFYIGRSLARQVRRAKDRARRVGLHPSN